VLRFFYWFLILVFISPSLPFAEALVTKPPEEDTETGQ
jgi:hypothetical protein